MIVRPRQQPSPTPAPDRATLTLFAMFHLNLAFSSIEERDRSAVIERCYWPLLAMAAAHGPIGIEADHIRIEGVCEIEGSGRPYAAALIYPAPPPARLDEMEGT